MADKEAALVALKTRLETITTGNGIIQFGVDSGSQRLVEIISLASETRYIVEDISVAKPSLGDVFLKYTGRQFRD